MYAVITGDIVGSTSTAEGLTQNQFSRIDKILSRAFGLMKEKGWLKNGDFVSFRGDSFQCILPELYGLEGALLIKSALKGGLTDDVKSSPSSSWSCRLVIGLGKVTYRADLVSKSNGPAFHRSGRTLDALPKDHFIAIVSPWDSVNEEFELLCRYMDIVIERLWTPISAITAWLYLREPMTQMEMAHILDIKQPAIHSRIHSAELPVLEQTINRYKSIIKSYST